LCQVIGFVRRLFVAIEVVEIGRGNLVIVLCREYESLELAICVWRWCSGVRGINKRELQQDFA
jgi:hypothetical protein